MAPGYTLLMNASRVVIVAADSLSRAGLAASLVGFTDLVVVGQLDSIDAAAVLAHLRPDVVLWDLGWGKADDLRATLEHISDLVEAGSPIAALLPDEAAAAEAWAAGVQGLLLRSASVEQLAATVAALSTGLAVIDPIFSVALFVTAHPSPGSTQIVEALTPRELEVLRLIAEGMSNKAIAQRLKISEHTVKFHANALMGKLGAQSRTDAVVRATRLGLIIL